MKSEWITLAVTPAEEEECRGLGLRLLHLGYRLSPAGMLLKSRRLEQVRGGILGIVGEFPEGADPASAAASVADACRAAEAEGVFLDFTQPTAGAARLLESLTPGLSALGARLYTNPPLHGPGASPLSTSEVTGGSFALYLSELQERYGERAVLEIVPLAVDFALPSMGQGEPVSRERLEELLDACGPGYYSRELAARYLTYQAPDGGAHFVLYDDAGTLREKLETARRQGIREAFLPYGPLRELLPDILLSE